MTTVRSLVKLHKFPSLWCGNRVSMISKCQNIRIYREHFICKNFTRHFRSARQTKSGPQHIPIADTESIMFEPIDPSRMWKPVLFTFAFSSTSVAAAAIWQYENLRKKGKSFLKTHGQWLNEQLYPKKQPQWREDLNKMWNSLSEKDKVFIPICLINVLVFLAWQVPRFKPTMLRYFCTSAAAKAICWPLILSTFSHSSIFHLGANMFVLHSFSDGAIATLGKEQFVGLYLTAGVTSALTTLLFRVAINNPGLSLGASGAIMAIIAYVCTAHPNSDLSIILLPFVTFKAGVGIKALMAMDTLGLILRWRFLDHAAHLGGALTGIAWYYYGEKYIWQKRAYVVKVWHDFRTSKNN